MKLKLEKALNNKISKTELLLIFIVFLFSPFIPFLIFFSLFLVYQKKSYFKIIFVFLQILLFSTINFTRSIDADWENYLNFCQSLNGTNLYNFLTESQLSVRIIEPLFYVFAWALSNLTNANLYLYSFFIAISIYGIYAYGINSICEFLGLKESRIIFCIICAFFVCINFSETSHLIRQYISGSILFLQIFILSKKKYFLYFILMIIGTLNHNSMILPSSFLLLSFILNVKLKLTPNFLKLFIVPGCIGILLGIFLNQYLIILNAENIENESSFYFSMIIDLMCFFFCVMLYFSKNVNESIKNFITLYFIFMAMYSCFLYIVHDNQLIFQRFYLYLEWFRIFGFLALTVLYPSLGKLNAQTLACYLGCLLFVFFRVSRTEWSYGNGLGSLLLKNFIQLILNVDL